MYNNKQGDSMIEVLYLFMMFSVVGWMWETPWVSSHQKKFINRGFLFGPYIPIYGFAVVTIIFSMSIFKGIETNVFTVLIQIIYMGLVTAVWEYVTSYTLEKIFHTRWWDYSRHPFNLNGRICLHVSIFFGIGGYLLWAFVYPPFMDVFSRIPNLSMIIILSVFYLVFLFDSYITLRDLFKFRNIIVTLEKISKELKLNVEQSLSEIKVSFKEYRMTLAQSITNAREELENRYKELPSVSSEKIKEQLNKISNQMKNSVHIKRFMNKFPTSKSRNIMKIRKRFEKQKKGE